MSVATLGGGCFWCLEAVFERVRGVQRVISGYAGGYVDNPSYEAVCRGDTGHAEVVQVVFDEAVLPYRQLLMIFFAIHDPTTLNRQGHDVGTQYRSVIFTHDDAQMTDATTLMAAFSEASPWGRPVVTEVLPVTKFFPAEDYHQHYFARHPDQPYCAAVVAPKLVKAEAAFGEWLVTP